MVEVQCNHHLQALLAPSPVLFFTQVQKIREEDKHLISKIVQSYFGSYLVLLLQH